MLKYLKKSFHALFDNIMIRINNVDIDKISNYKTLCYIIFMVSSKLAAKCILKSISTCTDVAERFAVIRLILVTFIDMLNTIIEVSYNPEYLHIFEKIRIVFVNNMETFYKKETFDELFKESISKKNKDPVISYTKINQPTELIHHSDYYISSNLRIGKITDLRKEEDLLFSEGNWDGNLVAIDYIKDDAESNEKEYSIKHKKESFAKIYAQYGGIVDDVKFYINHTHAQSNIDPIDITDKVKLNMESSTYIYSQTDKIKMVYNIFTDSMEKIIKDRKTFQSTKSKSIIIKYSMFDMLEMYGFDGRFVRKDVYNTELERSIIRLKQLIYKFIIEFNKDANKGIFTPFAFSHDLRTPEIVYSDTAEEIIDILYHRNKARNYLFDIFYDICYKMFENESNNSSKIKLATFISDFILRNYTSSVHTANIFDILELSKLHKCKNSLKEAENEIMDDAENEDDEKSEDEILDEDEIKESYDAGDHDEDEGMLINFDL